MKPSVGRIVHYQSYGTPNLEYTSCARAAIIAEVKDNDEVVVVVFNPAGLHFNVAKYSEVPKAGHWSWPPKT